MNEPLSDITPPAPLSLDELPAVEQLTLQDIHYDPERTLDIIRGSVATIRHLAFERDMFRKAFVARNARGGDIMCGLEDVRAAENYLARTAARGQKSQG
jgi:hypothetical protein